MGNTAKTSKSLDQYPELPAAQASEYDFMVLVDQSGSMGTASTRMPGKTRWEEIQEQVESFSRYADKYDDDGITLITFNSHAKVFDGVKADKVHELFANNQPGGSTNLADAIVEATKKKLSSSKKAIIVCFTDGTPNDPKAVENALIAASNAISDETQMGFLFVQVGDDRDATKYLDHLDNSLTGAKYDIVNTLSEDDAESLTPGQLVFQTLNH